MCVDKGFNARGYLKNHFAKTVYAYLCTWFRFNWKGTLPLGEENFNMTDAIVDTEPIVQDGKKSFVLWLS